MTDIFTKLERTLDQLSAKETSADKTVKKNIIESKASTFDRKGDVSGNLTANEKNKLVNQTKVFWDTYYKIKSKYEADVKGETKVAARTPAAAAAAKVQTGKALEESAQKESGGLLTSLLGGLPLLLKLGKSLFKGLGKGLGKIMSKVWGGIKRVIKGAWNLVRKGLGKLKGFIKNVWSKIKGSKLYKSIGNALTKAKDAIKSVFRSIRTKIGNAFKSVGKFIGNVWSKLTNTKFFKALTDGISKAKEAIKAPFKKVKELISPATKKAADVAKAASGKVAEKAGGFFSGAKSLVSKASGVVVSGVKAAGGAVVSGTKAAGGAVMSGAKAAARFALGPAKSLVSKSLGGAVKAAGGIGKFLGGTVARKIPIIGPIVEGLFARADIKKMIAEYEEGKITLDQLQEQAGTRAIQGITGMIGSAGGAALGSMLGSIIPIAGNAIGGILGAIGGDAAGKLFGNILAEHVIPPQYTKNIGSFVTKTPSTAPEMQDFIVQRGNVYPFSAKDQLLGMKTGGALDGIFGGLRSMAGSIGDKLGFSSSAKRPNVSGLQLELQKASFYLKMIAQDTRENTKYLKAIARTRGAPAGNSSSPSLPAPTLGGQALDSRGDYFNSAYSINVSPVLA